MLNLELRLLINALLLIVDQVVRPSRFEEFHLDKERHCARIVCEGALKQRNQSCSHCRAGKSV